MATLQELAQRIEDLRQRLHAAVTSGYDPTKIQAAHPISQELDRLMVEYTRRTHRQKR